MAFLSSTLSSIFFSSWICSKGTFSTTLKPTMVHECQEGFQFFHLKEQTFHCFLSLKATYSQRNFQRNIFKNIPSMRESKPSKPLIDRCTHKINKWCCLLPWEQSWCFMFWFLLSCDYSISLLINIALYYSPLYKLAHPERPIQPNKTIFKELLYKRDWF